MGNRALFLSLTSIFFACLLSTSPAQFTGDKRCDTEGMPFSEAARVKYECASTHPLEAGSGEREFSLKLGSLAAYPAQTYPWKDIDPTKEPERYLRTLLAYGLKDNVTLDWRIEDDKENRWCLAPWFQDLRERLRGMTKERGSRPFELHAGQKQSGENWAVGFYNAPGCARLALLWKDPAFPKTKDFAFLDGSFAIKLLFTTATPADVPYLAGSLEWKAAIGKEGQVATMRLLQVDVAVKDDRRNGLSGWLFGTFIYDAGTPGNTPYERLTPVGLSWGNDPTLTAFQYEQGGQRVSQSWVNPRVSEKFFALPRHNLGLFGRLNGPVDNPRSTCIACHGQALDWGRAILKDTLAEQTASLLKPGPPDPDNDGAVQKYFANLGKASFVSGTQALDYSLQVAIGVQNFRAWVHSYPGMADQTTDVPKLVFPSDPSDLGPLDALRNSGGDLPGPSEILFAR
ncbi:hypothetical protein C1D09_003470 [Mesorhizobium intechi]|uniref:Cytochrome c domain-containing protein n=1 Tax=Mesorhizobium intechi TaxID=537601 RepID=A0A8T9AVS3_9HYPH|nr:hypothetical protein [Mesorhizobium intechi]TSE13547.1 hypothetical protein C1D09_003470 [Mesorhizobium intechi]